MLSAAISAAGAREVPHEVTRGDDLGAHLIFRPVLPSAPKHHFPSPPCIPRTLFAHLRRMPSMSISMMVPSPPQTTRSAIDLRSSPTSRSVTKPSFR